MKYPGIAFVLIMFLMSCNQDNYSPSQAAFVTYLGTDTLAVEQFEKTGDRMTAQVILRSPQTTFSLYDLTLDESGGMEAMIRTDYPLEEGFSGEGSVVQSVQKNGDSLYVEVNGPDGTQTFSAPYEPGVLPFIDMVHWPFELAFNRAVEAGQDTLSQKLLTGRNLSDFIIADIDTDSMTIRHPFRGVMGVNVNENGDLMHLDAGLTTRKLQVHREPSVDMASIGEHFAAADQSGNPFGSLSGAEEAEFSFHEADFRVDYGVPMKRGRELFGGIVPWGELWRTGANRATHFYTSNDLSFGELEVPAGEYTLFTIPEPDGGTLIINRETGQNGNSYDESQDLGRVLMQISTKDDITEPFTIIVEEEDDSGGTLKLIWGETVFSAGFEVE